MTVPIPPNSERWRLLRDVAMVALGTFMLIHETLAPEPQPLILGAALTLLGLPGAIRAGGTFRR